MFFNAPMPTAAANLNLASLQTWVERGGRFEVTEDEDVVYFHPDERVLRRFGSIHVTYNADRQLYMLERLELCELLEHTADMSAPEPPTWECPYPLAKLVQLKQHYARRLHMKLLPRGKIAFSCQGMKQHEKDNFAAVGTICWQERHIARDPSRFEAGFDTPTQYCYSEPFRLPMRLKVPEGTTYIDIGYQRDEFNYSTNFVVDASVCMMFKC